MACCGSRSSKTPCKRLKGKSKLCPANKHAYPLSIALDRKVTSMPSEKSSGVGSARSSYLFPIPNLRSEVFTVLNKVLELNYTDTTAVGCFRVFCLARADFFAVFSSFGFALSWTIPDVSKRVANTQDRICRE